MIFALLLQSAITASTFYAGHQVVFGDIDTKILGHHTARTDNWVLAEVTDDGEQLRWQERPCRVNIAKVMGVTTKIADTTLPLLPPTLVTLTRNLTGAYSGKWQVAWPESGFPVEVQMPVCGGSLQVTTKSTTHATARRFGDDLLGEMNVSISQHILSASNVCLLLGGRDAVQPQSGVFHYRPVNARTCADVKDDDWPVAME